MALSSRGFASSPKMNKDVDERTVPNGEYRDALNVQVHSSDASDVGAMQSMLGNTLLSAGIVPLGSKCVGSIANDREDKIYYFVAGPTYSNSYEEGIWKDYIIEYNIKTAKFKYVFVDIYRVHIKTTGVNIGRDLPVSFNIASKPWTKKGSVRQDMSVEAYGPSTAQLASTIFSKATQSISFNHTSTTAKINIYSTDVDYATVSIPSGTLLKFKSLPVLNFSHHADNDKIITGINIIDDMLLWTDNYSEPKKINIKRCIAGTGGSVALPPINSVFTGDNPDFHTRLCVTPDKNSNLMVKPRSNNPSGTPWYMLEENVTVIRKSPRNCPRLIMSQNEEDRDGNPTYASTDGTSSNIAGPVSTTGNSFSYIPTPTTPSVHKVKVAGDIIKNVYVATDVEWRVGDLILFNQQQDINSAEGFTNHDVRANVISIGPTAVSKGPFAFKIQTIDVNKIDEEQKKWNLRLDQKKPIFEFKFVRFAFRYKYEDGEYSTFSPWSEPAFLAGEYDYLPVKGYNLGMTNRLRQLKVTGYIPEDIPQDVIQVDILYKDESSPNVYTVEEIISTDGWYKKTEKLWPDKLGFERNNPSATSGYVPTGSNAWRGEYKVVSELIHKTLPSNQLLRQWDNVPRLALAQEISGNRLVFGNYIQNFDLTDATTGLEIRPEINVLLSSKDAPLNVGNSEDTTPLNGLDNESGFAKPGKTCRSLRTYQVGVVYGDEYGRETPVLAGANGTGSITIPIENSSTLNRLRVDIGSKAPSFAKYYKFFVKETSNEYYNLAMDRWYDAEDGNIWLSFASADRNKVDAETHITLKKKHDKHEAVTDKATYKILAIENKAPDFIKTNVKSLGLGKDNGGYIGTSASGFPIKDADEMWIHKNATGVSNWYNGAITELMPMINDGTLYMRVRTTFIKSNWYQITKLKASGDWIKFKSDKMFGEDVNFTSTGQNYQSRVSGLMIELANHKVENKKEFEGRFFVKIYKDLALINNLIKASPEPKYRILHAQPLGYWNLGDYHFTEIVGTEHVNWERTAVLIAGELDKSSGCNDTSFGAYWADSGGDLPGATGKDADFFFKNWNNGSPAWFHNCDGLTCAARDNTKMWMQRSEGLFHIDAAHVRGTKSANGADCNRSSFTDEGNPSRGKGMTNSNKIMDIGYVHSGEYAWKISTDAEFVKFMTTKGTNFRFREDPDQLVYVVTGSEGNSKENSHYGKHHTWHEKTKVGMGNNKSRWKVEFERANLPGTGLGAGPSGYHILGNKSVTKNPNVAELGYYGGVINASSIAPGNGNKGHDGIGGNSNDALRVPAPPGTYTTNNLSGNPVDRCISGTTNYYKSIIDASGNTTVATFTGLAQAKRYREHTARYHFVEIIEPVEDEDADWSSKNPAIWETEPKEDVGMDIYYEASPALPIVIEAATNELFAPYGSMVNRDYSPLVTNPTAIASWSDNRLYTTAGVEIKGGDRMTFTRPDGFTTTAISNADPSAPYPQVSLPVNTFTIRTHNQDPVENNNYSEAPHNQPVYLSWYNAFAWGNGIESNRIRDDFNQVTIKNGVKASTVMATPYKEERRKTGLIHSGIYNSTSGVNSLNQFIQAESITKDMNPTYSSIQKLYTTDGNIVAYHEDRVMKILANKDALYNAGGGKNVAISSNFLGSDEPYATNHGISTNPESFAVDSLGRQYFADRSRSSICRLSQSGIDVISNYGMKDWFNDHLNPYTTKILGSIDAKKELYNLSISGALIDDISDVPEAPVIEQTNGCNCNNTSSKIAGQMLDKFGDIVSVTNKNSSVNTINLTSFKKTISFSEKVTGWTTFQSFIPEDGLSINNEYYTFKNGDLYKHHSNPTRNNFYGQQFDSSVSLVFNDDAATVKSFATINYEGSEARITSSLTDGEYYNLNSKTGWYVDSIVTDLQNCDNLEFVDKEGKWFSYIQGATTTLANLDESEFSVQGIGVVAVVTGTGPVKTHCLTITPNSLCVEAGPAGVQGCMDPSALNYNPNATVSDNTCVYSEATNMLLQVNRNLGVDYAEIAGLVTGGISPYQWGATTFATEVQALANSNWTNIDIHGAWSPSRSHSSGGGPYFTLTATPNALHWIVVKDSTGAKIAKSTLTSL